VEEEQCGPQCDRSNRMAAVPARRGRDDRFEGREPPHLPEAVDEADVLEQRLFRKAARPLERARAREDGAVPVEGAKHPALECVPRAEQPVRPRPFAKAQGEVPTRHALVPQRAAHGGQCSRRQSRVGVEEYERLAATECSSGVELWTPPAARADYPRPEPLRDGGGSIRAAAVRHDPFPRWFLDVELARPAGELIFLVQRGSHDRHEHGDQMVVRRLLRITRAGLLRPSPAVRTVGVGRQAMLDAEVVRRAWREGRDPSLRRRRTIAALASAGLADFAVISLYQFGAIRHLPDPPTRFFDSDRVNASKQAYAFGVPDGTTGALLYAAELVLAAVGGSRGSGRPFAASALLAGATATGAGAAVYYLWDMFAREKRACAYCLAGAALNLAMFPLALRDLAWDVRARRALSG
jgi:uncharacterized membrane protein